MSRSIWDSDPDYPVSEWQYEVANDDTRLGYWEWVEWVREIAAQDEADNETEEAKQERLSQRPAAPVTVNSFIDWMEETIDTFAATFHTPPTTPEETAP